MEEAKRRSRVLAFLLSFVVPGLGQIYNGSPLRGILLFVGYWLLFIAFVGLTRLIHSFWGLACILLIPLIISIVIAADAATRAARLKMIRLKWYNKWYLYVCILLFAHMAFIPAVGWVARDHIRGVRGYKMPSVSMEPFLKPGDYLVAKVEWFDDRIPARGEVVVFPLPEDTSKDFLKRVIGLPGEQLQIKDKIVFINGQRLEDPWGVYYSNVIVPARDNLPPITIPNGSVFVMGDNRDYSYDSRFWGCVEIKNITARALFIYWSDDRSRIGKQP
jgi:signal peptidase I